MASTVEQGEIKTLRPLSTTLELFDSFKSQEEDKDSDEESFHLPMLGCDDDNDIENGKEGTSTPNGETEDDILNKFETPEAVYVKEENLLNANDGTDKGDKGDRSEENKEDCEDTLLNDLEIIDETEDSFEETKEDEEKCANNDKEKKKREDKKEEEVNIELDDKTSDSINTNMNNEGENSGEQITPVSGNVTDKDTENSSAQTEAVKEDTAQIETEKIEQEKEAETKDKEEEIEEKLVDAQTKDEKLDDAQTKDDEVEFMELDVQETPEIDLDDPVEDDETKSKPEEQVTLSDAVPECTDMDVDVAEVDKTVNNKDEEVADESKLEEKEECEERKETEEKAKANESDSKDGQSNKDEGCDDLLDISVIRDADEDNASAIDDITDTLSNEKSDDNDEQDDKQENDVDEIEADQEDTLVCSDKDENMDFDEGNTNSCDQDTSTTDIGVSEHTSDAENKDSEIVQSESDSQHPPSVDDVTELNSNNSFADADNKSEEQVNEKSSESKEENEKAESAEISKDKTKIEKEKSASPTSGKRPLLETDNEPLPVANKKMRMSQESKEDETAKVENKSSEEQKKSMEEKRKAASAKNDKMKTLITFEKFMKQRNLGEGKLTRSDLEQFCLQKICEALVHKTDTGELHQTIKKQEQLIDTLRKDLQQLSKQTRDLDIVNKKLMNELRTQNVGQKPLVPLKITRSVGLQVKLNVGNDPARRKSHPGTATTPRTPSTPVVPPPVVNRQRSVQANNNVVRQVASTTSTPPSARKTPAPASILTQALQSRPTPTPAVATPPAAAKRSAIIRPKTADSQKPTAPGVIDLTDEDDKSAKNVSQKSILNKSTPIKIVQNKVGPKNTPLKVPPKTVALGQVKTTQTGTKVSLPSRTVTTIPQGVRLTPAQMKNGIAIPASVVTSSSGTPQLMYVVQPGSTGNSGTGVQKAVLLNFQAATNGVLTSALNGSTVSMIPSKSSNIQLKTLPVSRKHPAPLPLPPPAAVNASLKPLLPKPHLSIRKTDNGIILQWRMPYNLDIYEGIASYQLFAYQETNAPPSTDMWRKVGDVKALALPMACTLTQFVDKNKYYFAVRSVDVHKRIGAFSDPEEISL